MKFSELEQVTTTVYNFGKVLRHKNVNERQATERQCLRQTVNVIDQFFLRLKVFHLKIILQFIIYLFIFSKVIVANNNNVNTFNI